MDILKVLRKEENKLAAVATKAETKLSQVRAAINALSTNGKQTFDGRKPVDPRRGRKLSAAHRRAIKAGIRKARAAKS